MKIYTLKAATWILTILLLIIVLIINLYIFPKHAIERNNENLISLDQRSSYNYEEVMELLTIMGDDGRKTYRYSTGVVDMIYPLVYGVLLGILLLMIVNQVFKRTSYFKLLLILPLLIVFFDYSENLNTLKMLDAFPSISEDMVKQGSIYSGIKWYLVSVTLILIIAGSLFLTAKLVITKKESGENA